MKKKILPLLILLVSTNTNALELTETKTNNTDNLVWTGHLSPDTDSVTSAMLAAYIYGGTPTSPQKLNPETQFVLKYCQTTTPIVTNDFTNKAVGVVDFNQKTQLHQTIAEESIVSIIDHHILGNNSINPSKVISIDIRPWGSTATILTHHAESLNIALSPEIACVALGGILSDTILLQSPITTSYDNVYAEKLAVMAGISNIKAFGQEMLEEKSKLENMSAADILTLDYKSFSYAKQKIGIGVAETIDPDKLLKRKKEFITAMKNYKEEQGLDYLFFSVTDIKNKQANLLWVDDKEGEIIQLAFEQHEKDQWLKLPGVISRKKQIAPAIKQAIEG